MRKAEAKLPEVMSRKMEILWTTEDLPRDQAYGTPTHGYRIVCYDRDTWFAKFRKVSVMTLERQDYNSSLNEGWVPVGRRVSFLRWPPRVTPDMRCFHSKKTGIAYLKGWAGAYQDARTGI